MAAHSRRMPQISVTPGQGAPGVTAIAFLLTRRILPRGFNSVRRHGRARYRKMEGGWELLIRKLPYLPAAHNSDKRQLRVSRLNRSTIVTSRCIRMIPSGDWAKLEGLVYGSTVPGRGTVWRRTERITEP
jgi:hypothetical protein